MMGYVGGINSAKNIVNKDICITENFKKDEERKHGCNHITLNKTFNKINSLSGLRIYRNNNTTFFLANDGAYEINNNLQVVNFTPNYKREDFEKKIKERARN